MKKATGLVVGIGLVAFALVTLAASGAAFAQVIDPSFEVFRIRCQIDIDIDPATGLEEPKVQIQAKARADLLDTFQVGIQVENISASPQPFSPDIVYTVFELGSATADWDTFPDPADLTPVTFVPGDFVVADEEIKITAQVTGTLQTVSDVAKCADKTSSQFTQQTKNVCKLKDFLRNKCKTGDLLPDGTIQQ